MSAKDRAPAAGQHINQDGLKLIENFEGLEKKIPNQPGKVIAYQDPIGIWTIGYGHTKGVHEGMVITEQQAEAFLREDVQVSEQTVGKLVTVPLNSNEFSALVSFTFNVGRGTLQRSSLLRLLNAGNYQGAAERFLLFVKAGGRTLPGLVKRREAEKTLFLK